MNHPSDISWWPDLSGQTIAILAAGPSINQAQCDLVREAGWTAVAINESWRLATWAHIHYICDWQYARTKIPPREAFSGMRVIGTWPSHPPKELVRLSDVLNRIHIRAGMNRPIWDGHMIGAGGNSAFQMANWVRRCGAEDIVLLGVDCHSPNVHWHGGHDHSERPVQDQATIDNWKRSFKRMAADPEMKGVRVTNCSPGTELKVFPFVPLTEMIQRKAA